jgi:hypothetical protein
MSRSFFKTAVLAFAFTEAASATLQYTLATADDYTGTSFWDGFNFITVCFHVETSPKFTYSRLSI